jgi:hypothetical protein
MSRFVLTALAACVVLGAGSAEACGPGASLTAKGAGAPFYSAPPGFGYSSAFEAQKQLLAQQAAAYGAQRQPIRLAKALRLREEKLADRAERRALFVQKYQEDRRRKGLDDPMPQDAPQVASQGHALNR